MELAVSFDVQAKNGVREVIKSITGEIKAPQRSAVGFVMDANDEVDGRWDSIREQLERMSIALPDKPQPSGTIVDNAPRVGVWLMPDNRSRGELEDFVAQMIPEDDAVWPLAREYIQGIPKKHRQFRCKIRKAEVYAWLASREEPGPMGAAIRKRDLSTDGQLCRDFSQWLKRLFE